MYKLKFFFIKIRFFTFLLYWFLFRHLSFILLLNKTGVNNVKISNFSLWSEKVFFFRACHEQTQLFIKVIHLGSTERERTILQALNNSNLNDYIPKCYQQFSNCNFDVIAIDYLSGGNLKTMSLDYDSLNYLLIKFKDILDIMAELNLVHCDIRPENLILTDTGQLKVIDFEYAVLKNSSFDNLDFATPTIIAGLGEEFSCSGPLFDDAYSFVKVANYLTSKVSLNSEQMDEVNSKISSISRLVNRNIYSYR